MVFMHTVPNLISLSRILFALVFLVQNPIVRSIGIVGALLTDWLDGFVARKYKVKTQLGAALDPLADRIFVLFAFMTLIAENQLQVWQMVAMLSRDIAIILFGIHLAINGLLLKVRLRAIWCGKVTTVLQLFLLLALIMGYQFPPELYSVFVVLGCFSFFELSYNNYRQIQVKE
jgi:CDP-diacylglycerol---glycerol-3-phosphate 3-phosphatidyltransferase